MADHMHGGGGHGEGGHGEDGHGEDGPQGPWVGGWLLSAVAGLIAAVMARFVGDVGFAATLLVAVVVFLVFGVLLGLFWGNPMAGEAEDHPPHHAPPAHPTHVPHVASLRPLTPVAPVAAAEPLPEAVPLVAQMPLAPMPEAAPVAPSEPLAPMPATDPVALSEPLAPAEPVPPVETIATLAEEEPLEPLEPVAVLEPVPTLPVEGGGQKPQGLDAPLGGKADDLQVIEGIGPVLEKLCHQLGIFHFDQIAGWGPEEVAWMDGNLKGFRGRVTRDRWVAQARLIGAVGVEAFLIRAKANDY